MKKKTLFTIVLAFSLMINGSAFAQRTWNEQKILASDGAEEDHFGYSVSISGDQAIVGAPGDDDNGDSGRVFRPSTKTHFSLDCRK